MLSTRIVLYFTILSLLFCSSVSFGAKAKKGSSARYKTQITYMQPMATSDMNDALEYGDVTPPEVFFSLPDVWETAYSGKPTIHITGTATDDTDLVSVRWENQNGLTGLCIGTSSWDSTGVVLFEGENLICVTAEDSAGNVGAASVLITYNPNGPTVTIITPTTEAQYTTPEPNLTIGGTADGDREVSSVAWTTDKGFSGTCTGTNQWTAADVPLTVGTNVFTVTAVDSQGEYGSKTLTITVPDITMPEISIVSPTPDLASRRVGATIPVSGTASDNLALKLISWETDRGHTGVCEGRESWSISELPLELGDNKLTITATDSSDNTTVACITITRQQTKVAEAFLGLSMVSLPMVPDIENPKTAVGFYGECWASYNPELGIYHTYPDIATYLQPRDNTAGRGFWAAFTGNISDPLGYATPLNKAVPLHLYPGWNIIGNPYNASIPWDTDSIMIKLNGSTEWLPMGQCGDSIRNYAIGWQQDSVNPLTGAYYPVADVVEDGVLNSLAPWRAYWIKVFEECDLLLPVPSMN